MIRMKLLDSDRLMLGTFFIRFMNQIRRALRIVIVFLPALMFVVMMRLIRRVCLIRIAPATSSRIGHLINDILLYVIDHEMENRTARFGYDIIFHESKNISNRYAVRMLKRYVRIWPRFFFSTVYNLNRVIPGGQIHGISSLNTMCDINNVLPELGLLSFSREEESRGQDGLRRLGIEDNAKFIILHVRDEAYLRDPSRSDRNANIFDYLLVAEALAQRGYYVVRAGATALEKMPTNNPKIIDYAFSRFRTEFMDLYLGANCFMSVGTGAGISIVPYVFNRRNVYTDHNRFGYTNHFRGMDLVILKGLRQRNNGKILTQSEIWDSGAAFGHQQWFDDHDIEVISNTPEEIRDVVLEMVDRLEGKNDNLGVADEYQLRFWSIFYSNHDEKSEWKDLKRSRVEIGSQFLIDHPELLE